ncbi:PDGLE domain-containing protein [Actinomadura sp. WMMB 499]|uniref:PDGLE domain-containing protein n=1 Tax=Actinomadura sp. WMMB 499 TaxID=1219491 RepID=UPI0020C7BDC0|nr:PDGLE domain-containing protein [Actinomadura sp. WMMB 499]
MQTKRFFAGFLIVSAILAGIVSFYASSSPDGLEKVAADKGIAAKEEEHGLAGSPLGDYGVEGIGNARLSGGLAGLIGVGLTLAVGGGLFWTIRRRGGPEARAGTRAESRTD